MTNIEIDIVFKEYLIINILQLKLDVKQFLKMESLNHLW